MSTLLILAAEQPTTLADVAITAIMFAFFGFVAYLLFR